MTNNELKAMISKYGDRIFALGMNNNKALLLGYPHDDETKNVDIHDLTFETLADGMEVFYVPHVDTQSNGVTLKYSLAHATEFIEYIGIMDATQKDYRPQVNGFK